MALPQRAAFYQVQSPLTTLKGESQTSPEHAGTALLGADGLKCVPAIRRNAPDPNQGTCVAAHLIL